MQDSSSRVRLGRSDHQDDAFRSIENHDGAVGDNEDEVTEVDTIYRAQVRRGALWGGLAGFAFGLMPLLASTILGAIAGAMITRASRLRIDRVSAPRIHFARRMREGHE
jgi:uncharacterized membrane protein